MYLAITIATVVLATLLISSGLYLFGLYSRATEKEHGLMAAELVRTELLMRLMAGTFDEAEMLPDLVEVIPALHSLHIARSDAVVSQFGGENDGPRSEPGHGDFSGRLDEGGPDEISQMSGQMNRLMATLEDGFGTIVKDVEALSGHHHAGGNRNLLAHTVETVRSMVDAVRFRQTIEADRGHFV